jgi:hypothetical protein
MISILKNNVKKSRLSKLRLKENAYKLEKQNHLNIHVVFYLEGDIKEDKAKAAQLSLKNTVRFPKH